MITMRSTWAHRRVQVFALTCFVSFLDCCFGCGAGFSSCMPQAQGGGGAWHASNHIPEAVWDIRRPDFFEWPSGAFRVPAKVLERLSETGLRQTSYFTSPGGGCRASRDRARHAMGVRLCLGRVLRGVGGALRESAAAAVFGLRL